MAYQSTVEFTSGRLLLKAGFEHPLPKAGFDRGLAPSEHSLSALEEELALMDAAIPLTPVPDCSGSAHRDMPIWNIFHDGDQASIAPVMPRRVQRRSRVRQGRLIALRRRAILLLLCKSGCARKVWRASAKTELQALRSCIYVPQKSEPALALPLRIAAHAISLALIVTALPAGIALLACNLLKGEDMRVTARLTTLSGMALVVIGGNPWLAAIAGI